MSNPEQPERRTSRRKISLQAITLIILTVASFLAVHWFGTKYSWELFALDPYFMFNSVGGLLVAIISSWWLYHFLPRHWQVALRTLVWFGCIFSYLFLAMLLAWGVVYAYREDRYIGIWLFFLCLLVTVTVVFVRMTVRSFREWRELAAEDRARKDS